jgi:hypothetical protein
LALLVDTISPKHLTCKATEVQAAFDKVDAEAASALQERLMLFAEVMHLSYWLLSHLHVKVDSACTSI